MKYAENNPEMYSSDDKFIQELIDSGLYVNIVAYEKYFGKTYVFRFPNNLELYLNLVNQMYVVSVPGIAMYHLTDIEFTNHSYFDNRPMRRIHNFSDFLESSPVELKQFFIFRLDSIKKFLS